MAVGPSSFCASFLFLWIATTEHPQTVDDVNNQIRDNIGNWADNQREVLFF